MKKNSGNVIWRSLLFNSFVVSGILSFKCDRAFSQITPDNTLGDESSVVNSRDATSESIDGGAVRGQNLFHSFEEFSVGEDRGVYFANPDAVTNIFSRVTGNDVSNILGTLGVDGAADLFLINPNGIVFGEGASLDVQGSFTATTADGIEFEEQGFFSAVNPTNSVLTISVPLGLQFGSNPGSIINRSFVKDSTGDFVGLQVPSGENLTLVGGDVSFEEGMVKASGGKMEIGGLSAAGTIAFNDDGSLNFPENVTKANISLSNAAAIDVTGTGGGNVNINANNLTLETGEFGGSTIRAGITPNSTTTEAQVGDITINATDNVTVDESFVVNQVAPGARGNTGGVSISTTNLNLNNGGRVSSSIFGQGDAGNVTINATGTITADGETLTGSSSGVTSNVSSSGVGDAGDIIIFTNNLNLTDGGEVDASTFGQGDAGAINITATGDITADGEDLDGVPSGVTSTVDTDAIGNVRGITISTTNLNLNNGGTVNANTFGQGDAGAINITATGDITADGENSDGVPSGLTSQVASEALGDAEGITISTTNLSLSDGGQVSASTFGQGNAGAIDITATGDITANGEDSDSVPSAVASQVAPEALGDAGGITISTTNLSLSDGGQVGASTLGQGNAGLVKINAIGDITADGETSDGFPSGVSSGVNPDAVGNAGGVIISTTNLNLANGGRVTTSTFGQGKAGELVISAEAFNLDNSAFISSQSESTFEAGNITLNIANSLQAKDSEISTSSSQSSGGNLTIAAGDIQLRGDSDITTNIFSGEGSGGNIAIKADSIIAFDDSDIFAFAVDGQGGNITLDTPAFFAENFTLNSLTAENTQLLENNNRADVNATGNQPGVVSVPDVSFIQNSLTELENNSINTDELVANSCVSPVSDRQQGKFIITGGQSLPVRPGDGIPSKYPTGEVRNVPESNHSSWQPGDPIVEPQGAYRLANGKLVLSRECN